MRCVAYGERAAWLDLEGADLDARLSIVSALRDARSDLDVVLGADAVAVHGIEPDAAQLDALRHLATRAGERAAPAGKQHIIRVVYDGADLADIAAATRLSRAEIIRAHTDRAHRVELVGFMPGFAYLGDVDPRLHLPRRPTPRTRVPANAVAIAGGYTGVYPAPSPGGWHLLGHAVDFTAFDTSRVPPSPLAVGDEVHFVDASDGPMAAVSTAASPPTPTRDARSPTLRVVSVPPGTTLQDAGRPGWLGRGVPPSGPLDALTHRAANRAVGNPPDATAIEIPLGAARFIADAPLLVSIDGSAPRRVEPSELLEVPQAAPAVRYLAVAPRVSVVPTLGATATLLGARLGGLRGRMLRAGDLLPLQPGGAPAPPDGAGTTGDLPARAAPAHVGDSSPPDVTGPYVLAASLAPRAHAFPPSALATFFAQTWTLSRAGDRVGVRLEGPALALPSAPATPAPMVRGAVQITTSGVPIVLGPDHPTTGGYPVIAVLTLDAQAALARLRPGEAVRFLRA